MLKINSCFIISSILLSITNVAFFSYGFHTINTLTHSIKSDCGDYLKYNVGVLSLFALSLVVTFSYICCSNLVSNIIYVLNAIALTSLAIDRYVRKETICDYNCEMKCGDLVTLGNNIEIFFIVDLSIIALSALTILCVLGSRVLGCCGYYD
jgi:hypothetical protein